MKKCTWPFGYGGGCENLIEEEQDYCPEHEREAKGWAEDEEAIRQALAAGQASQSTLLPSGDILSPYDVFTREAARQALEGIIAKGNVVVKNRTITENNGYMTAVLTDAAGNTGQISLRLLDDPLLPAVIPPD